MRKIKVDSIGFTEASVAKRAENMICVGASVVIGGVLLILAGLKRIVGKEQWFEPTNEDSKDKIRNMYDNIADSVDH